MAPNVELRACRPCGVHYSTTLVGAAAGFYWPATDLRRNLKHKVLLRLAVRAAPGAGADRQRREGAWLANVEERPGIGWLDCSAAQRRAGASHWRAGLEVDDNPEVIPNPDIRVEAASAWEEKGLTGRKGARHWTEPEERRVTEPEERRVEKPEERRVEEPEERRVEEPKERRDPTEKQLGKDRNTETPAATDERHGRNCHIPGGARLSQSLPEFALTGHLAPSTEKKKGNQVKNRSLINTTRKQVASTATSNTASG
ncbi:hypothetical protein NDU88_010057 [Pleurodeles waltl]|uniref:Uncharacterized protein n=1 Tax=Pleurodeles waltl TaxID=8319 RepID=A0AAV7RZI7_PLEWA|nr:hypothetical protein NDU88_010057 [Pleurodeles waltl]